MRHGQKGRKFGRETKQRKALLRSLAVSLIEHRKIRTSQTKAKSLRPFIEKIVTKSKGSRITAIRSLTSQLGVSATHVLLKDITPRFADRNGGYTRIYNLGPRASDGAKEAIIEFVS